MKRIKLPFGVSVSEKLAAAIASMAELYDSTQVNRFS
jgi:hypothetical protein